MHRIFVYGTLKRGQPNNHILCNKDIGTATYVGSAQTLQKFPLVIASKFNIPYLMPIEGTGCNIIGHIYEVDEPMLKYLDDFEGHPTYYERRLIQVAVGNYDTTSSEPANHEAEASEQNSHHNHPRQGETLECWCYFLLNPLDYLLQMPFISNYDSYGPHGRQYVPKYARPPNEPSASEQVQSVHRH